MSSRSASWQYTVGGISFLSFLAAALIAAFAGDLASSDAGVIGLIVVGIIFAVAVIGIDIPAAIDSTKGNTFSELLRKGGTQTTIFPWAFSVYAGRWFHPVDGLELLGVWGAVILMIATWLLVVVGDILRRHGHPLPSWLVVSAGLLAGALLWPADFEGNT